MTVRPHIRSPRFAALVLLVPLALTAAACGDDDDDTATGQSGGTGGDEELSIDITTPADGDAVESPFEMQVDASVELGETDTGLHHIHLHFDGDEDYDIVYADSFTVERDLDEGEHTVQAVIANADHSETDANDEITVTVGSAEGGSTGGGGGGDGGDDSTTTEDPYGY